MKENGLVLKKYEMDYSFIVKNYLNPKLWEKTWVLFTYKEFVVTLKLSSISCYNNKIDFKLTLKDYSPERKYRYDWGFNSDKETNFYVDYSLKLEDLSFLQRKIQNKIYELITALERQHVRTFEIYQETEENEDYEEEKLRTIAESFLDDNNVTNKDIRDVYIDNYINNNKKIEQKLLNILDSHNFKVFTDFYLVFANSTKDDNLIQRANEDTKEVLHIKEIQKEVKEYLEYMETEEFEEEMQDNLEEI